MQLIMLCNFEGLNLLAIMLALALMDFSDAPAV